MKTVIRLFLAFLYLVALGLKTYAVSPPPDGGYAGGNTAEGQNALFSLATGTYNTAVGFLSLRSNTNGSFNTATGAGTLLANTADANTATGAGALLSNTTGSDNTAIGAFALYSNTTGFDNTATGASALFSNTTGLINTADGFAALYSNTTGSNNTACGDGALNANTTGLANTAIGTQALNANTTGNFNTAVGQNALINHTTGTGNTALGDRAGDNVITASNVICIGYEVGGADVSNTTWIGNVYGDATISGQTSPVIVSVDGQLATVVSSERFKKGIATMEKSSEAILSLRPVTFHYKSDATGTPQFGLIAEEVAKVNPALVLPDKQGKPFTVRYDAVNAMLLNEFLKEHKAFVEEQHKVEKLQATVGNLVTTVKEQASQIQKVSAQLEASKPAPQVVNNNQ